MDTIRPRVTFTKIPSKTYSNATIQWNVSEPVNGSCEIRGPANFYRNVSCNGNWVGVNLPPGSFTLGVTLIDTSGNVGGPSRHQWINGNSWSKFFFFSYDLQCKRTGQSWLFFDYMYIYMHIIMHKDRKKYLDFKSKKTGIVFIKIIVRIVKEIMLTIKASFLSFALNCLPY